MSRQAPWFFVCAVMVGGFFVVAQIYAMLPLLRGIASDLQISGAQASFIPTAFGLAYAGGLLVFGPIADRMDRMLLLVGGLVALAAASACVALAQSYESLMAGRALQGLAAATFPATALALVSQQTPAQDQPLAISMMGFSFLSSAPLSQVLVEASALPFGQLMVCSAALYLLCAAATLLAGSRVPRGTGDAKRGTPSDAVHVDPRTAPPLAALTIAPASILFGYVSFHAHGQVVALADPAMETQLLRLVGFPPLLLCFTAPRIMRRHGPAVTACNGLALVALSLALASVGANLFFASMLLSAGVALAVPGLIAAVTFWSGSSVRARSLATYTFFLFSGASIAPVSAHILAGAGGATTLAFPAFLALCAATTLYMARPTGDPLDPATR